LGAVRSAGVRPSARTRREARARFEEFASLSLQDKLRRFKVAEAFAYSVVVPILKATDAHPMHEDDDAAY